MQQLNKYTLLVFCALLLAGLRAEAGNRDRAGQAGATELLINPWARSAGFHALNTSYVRGIEAMQLNVGGFAFVERTEVLYANSMYLMGSDISINALGLGQHIGKEGEGGVIGSALCP